MKLRLHKLTHLIRASGKHACVILFLTLIGIRLLVDRNTLKRFLRCIVNNSRNALLSKISLSHFIGGLGSSIVHLLDCNLGITFKNLAFIVLSFHLLCDLRKLTSLGPNVDSRCCMRVIPSAYSTKVSYHYFLFVNVHLNFSISHFLKFVMMSRLLWC